MRCMGLVGEEVVTYSLFSERYCKSVETIFTDTVFYNQAKPVFDVGAEMQLEITTNRSPGTNQPPETSKPIKRD